MKRERIHGCFWWISLEMCPIYFWPNSTLISDVGAIRAAEWMRNSDEFCHCAVFFQCHSLA